MASTTKKSKKFDFDEKEDFGTTEQFVCRICGEVMSSLSNYMDHCRRSHKALVDKKAIDVPKKCVFCSVYFASNQGLENHVRTVHGIFADTNPPVQNVIDIALPVTMTERTVQKRVAKRKNVPKSDDVTSQAAISVVQSSDVKTKSVSKSAPSKSVTVTNERNKPEESESLPEGTFKCRFCEKMSRSSRDHVRHVKNCNPNATAHDMFEDPHDCPLCGRVFRAKVHLERHFHMKHRGQPWGILDPYIGAYDAYSEKKRQEALLKKNKNLESDKNVNVSSKRNKRDEAKRTLNDHQPEIEHDFDDGSIVIPDSPELT